MHAANLTLTTILKHQRIRDVSHLFFVSPWDVLPQIRADISTCLRLFLLFPFILVHVKHVSKQFDYTQYLIQMTSVVNIGYSAESNRCKLFNFNLTVINVSIGPYNTLSEQKNLLSWETTTKIFVWDVKSVRCIFVAVFYNVLIFWCGLGNFISPFIYTLFHFCQSLFFYWNRSKMNLKILGMLEAKLALPILAPRVDQATLLILSSYVKVTQFLYMIKTSESMLILK